ncbi:MAG: HypC/HybG/HupF family hydrogenase formation chaperone [Planctomycetaceae bacterium]|nr:HypC/HybG/HupF family hydrogenase formation chaperone [Planctomycetaceae bacterium]
MCLAVPGKVVEWLDPDPLFATAVVEFGGIRRTVSLACVPESRIGDYVLVHAGVAICQVDEEEAARVLATLEDLEDHLGDGDEVRR